MVKHIDNHRCKLPLCILTLDTLKLDAIVVATTAETHYPVIRAALIKGLHVLAAEPLTLTIAESIELCGLVQKK